MNIRIGLYPAYGLHTDEGLVGIAQCKVRPSLRTL